MFRRSHCPEFEGRNDISEEIFDVTRDLLFQSLGIHYLRFFVRQIYEGIHSPEVRDNGRLRPRHSSGG
jgi:hypothetical protein